MDYEPREGVDYIIDLYQLAGVNQTDEPDSINKALNARLLEYHPDRLQGLAPEFQTSGARMAQLLNRAKVVLLDNEKRSEYDEILTTWQGPVSKNGTPVIRIDDALRVEAAQRSPEELEAAFSAQSQSVAKMVKHNPKQQILLGKLYEDADGEDADELREAYDAALFAEDQVLAIEEAERGRLLGLVGNKRYETAHGYAETVQAAIEGARAEQLVEHQRRMVGGVSTRLALMAGEYSDAAESSVGMSVGSELPHYFDEQAKKITDLAAKREALLERRLAIFQPNYPIPEVQTQPQPNFVIGVANDKETAVWRWIGFSFDAEAVALANIEVPESVEQLLAAAEYEQAYASGFNILTFVTKDQIEIQTLLEEAYTKHIQKYYPGLID